MRHGKILAGLIWAALCPHMAHAALKNVLIYSMTAGYRHDTGIPDGNALIDSLGKVKGFTVVKTEDPTLMTYTNMKKYDVIVFNNTTGPVLPTATEQADFIKYLTEGGGWLGFHGAMDHHGYWQWYTDQGVDFNGHMPGVANCNLDTAKAIQKPEYADIVKVFPKTSWSWEEEWYAFKENPRRNSDILITVDENSPKWAIPTTQKMGDHAVAWAHKLPPVAGSTKQGHYFYTSIGHGGIGSVFKKEIYVNEFMYQAMRWAAGEMDGAISAVRPNASKFLSETKTEAASIAPSQIDVAISELGAHQIDILNMKGQRVDGIRGNGPGTWTFPNLTRGSIYIVKINVAKRVVSSRVFVQ